MCARSTRWRTKCRLRHLGAGRARPRRFVIPKGVAAAHERVGRATRRCPTTPMGTETAPREGHALSLTAWSVLPTWGDSASTETRLSGNRSEHQRRFAEGALLVERSGHPGATPEKARRASRERETATRPGSASRRVGLRDAHENAPYEAKKSMRSQEKAQESVRIVLDVVCTIDEPRRIQVEHVEKRHALAVTSYEAVDMHPRHGPNGPRAAA
jgi:hypothetical protein